MTPHGAPGQGPAAHVQPHLTDEQAQLLADPRDRHDPSLAAARAHVHVCPDCATLVESYVALGDALAALPAPALPDDFTAGVLARIDTREAERAYARRLAAAITLASFGVAAGLLTLSGGIAWAPAFAEAGAWLGGLTRALGLAEATLGPVVRALRLQLLVWCVLTALPLFFGLRRLLPARSHAPV